ncbi:MAG TPA: rod shape-determining protein MreC [Acidobacteriaceae bacterium]|jgi:rod shape-determining protein MreC|nr:rod shape-determining protein MreC [Acidobacteriaceae bacterium]
MESFFSRYRNALVLIAVLLAQVIGLAVQVRRPGQTAGDKGGVRLIRAWVVGAVSPPERLLHATGLGLRGVWTNYLDLIHIRQQNKNLQAQIDQLRLEEASLSEDARQGKRLQALLGFQQKYIYKTVAAQVIGTAGTEQSHVLFIDKGSKDGIAPDMPVITPDGIVGKTRDVFDYTSQVLEISDATSGAGVILQQTRIQGVLRGNSWGQPELVNISPDDRIKAGEPVVTSGGDSIYPRGLAVGTLDRVVPEPDGTLVNVLVKPAADLSRLEEVLVITSTGSEMPSQMQQDLTDAQQKASDILAERLPSRADPNAPPVAASANGAAGTTGTPAPNTNIGPPPLPARPPAPIHVDHFSPSTVPPAEDLVPGQKLSNSAIEGAGGPAGGSTGPKRNAERATTSGSGSQAGTASEPNQKKPPSNAKGTAPPPSAGPHPAVPHKPAQQNPPQSATPPSTTPPSTTQQGTAQQGNPPQGRG